MKRALVALLVLFATLSSQATNRVWTNTLSGDWFGPANWSPNGVPAGFDTAIITNNGTYEVDVLTNTAAVTGLTLGGSSGTQTLINGFTSIFTVTNAGVVRANGVLSITNGGLSGNLAIQSGGTLVFNGPSTKTLYGLDLLNQGTILWLGGYLGNGGTPTSVITNLGLWDIQSDYAMNWLSGPAIPLLVNQGTLRKSAGVGITSIDNQNFVNTGFIDVQSGTLLISTGATNLLAGTVNVDPGATFNLSAGMFYDSGGIFTNSGIHQITGGTLTLLTNILTGLSLDGGTLLLGPGFQQAGAITNLTLNGITLAGTNTVGSGFLTVSNGGLTGELTIQPSGTLVFNGPSTKTLYGLDLFNQGTVLWLGGYLGNGGTPTSVITNLGLWDIQSDYAMNWLSGPAIPLLVNQGTLRKSAGVGITSIDNQDLRNNPAGIIQVNTGTLQLPGAYTNTAGTLQVNGGTLSSSGTLTVAGGSLDGSGNVGANLFTGGTLSPGQGGPGLITFPSGLNMGAGSTLTLSGTGTAPGAYDQLSVLGSVILSNATLQVTSLPSVSAGTTFIIITNDGADAVLGTFNGLPENSTLNISGQSFQIHYAGGSGNDVTLVRVAGSGGPAISFNGFTNGNWRLSGMGVSSTGYTIQATTNFLSWTNVGTITSDGSGKFIFVDTNTPHFHYRFYRTTN